MHTPIWKKLHELNVCGSTIDTWCHSVCVCVEVKSTTSSEYAVEMAYTITVTFPIFVVVIVLYLRISSKYNTADSKHRNDT